MAGPETPKEARSSSNYGHAKTKVLLTFLLLALPFIVSSCGAKQALPTFSNSDLDYARLALTNAPELRGHNRGLAEQWAMLKRVGERLIWASQPVCLDIAKKQCALELVLVRSNRVNAFAAPTTRSQWFIQSLKSCQDVDAIAKAPGYQSVLTSFFKHGRKGSDQWCILEKEILQVAVNIGSIKGAVLFSPGIVDLVNSEDELAAIMAHEFAHHIKSHIKKDMYRALFLITLVRVGESALFGSSSGGILSNSVMPTVENFSNRLYSKSEEAQADYIGAFLVARAGYNLDSAVQVWARLLRPNASRSPGFLDTHPAAAHRVATWQKTTAALRSSPNALPFAPAR